MNNAGTGAVAGAVLGAVGSSASVTNATSGVVAGAVAGASMGQASSGSSNGPIGFNLERADAVVAEIGDLWREHVLYERQSFLEVQNTLRREWVGPDEQQFEQLFVTRLRHLYQMTSETVSQASAAISAYAVTWAQWQASNNIDTSSLGIKDAGVSENDSLDAFIAEAGRATPTIQNIINPVEWIRTHATAAHDVLVEAFNSARNWIERIATGVGAGMDEYLTFIPREYEDGFRGLTNGIASATACQRAVEEFVNEVKEHTTGLFNAIEVNQAFYGEQVGALKNYIDGAGRCVVAVATAVKDLNDALAKVAGSNYSAQENLAAQNIQAESQNMQDTVSNSIANAKWN